jgi:hypothetical protein
MIISLYISAAVIMAVGSLYFAWRSRDFRKFLAGAFFVSWGIFFYIYLADVSDTSDQRHPLHSPFHPLPALFLLWLRQEAKSLKRTPSHVRKRRYRFIHSAILRGVFGNHAGRAPAQEGSRD